MSISKRWIALKAENMKQEQNFYAVYELGNSKTGKVLYIGQGKLKSRLLSHNKKEHFVGVNSYRYILMGSKIRCEQKERALQIAYRKKYKTLPKYNCQLGEIY